MKCDACGREVALARVCPYCGTKLDPKRPEPEEEAQEPKGEFRGRVEGDPAPSRSRSQAGLPGLGQIIRFLLDPRIGSGPKGLFLAALLYVLSPIDILPVAFLPIDDLAVLVMALRMVASALDRLDRSDS